MREPSSVGLYPKCSMLNHSCFPNAIFVSDSGRQLIITTKPIKKGEEICVTYILPLQLYQPTYIR